MFRLAIDGLEAGYGAVRALHGVSLEIRQGETVALIGGNGAGKTTTLRAVSGLLPLRRGRIELDGRRLDGLGTADIVGLGVAHVPEGRQLFPTMTVRENLELGAFVRRHDKKGMRTDRDRVFGLFPRLAERRGQLAGTLSGGEQQMVAMARALMARPRLLCMDEPSMGLSPHFVAQVFEIIQEINRQGTSIFMVEQNANMALSIASYGYVLQTGEVVVAGDAKSLLDNEMVQQAYLGEMKGREAASA